MGLENQLMDISSESFPILIVALIANSLTNLRSFFFTIFHTLGLSKFNFNQPLPAPYQVMDSAFCDAVGSGLAGVIMLAEQLNLNRVFSYEFKDSMGGGCAAAADDEDGLIKCVFCLNRLCKGDRVRKLACRHVFHKDCFDGWLDQQRFTCPTCRSPLVEDKRVEFTRRQVTGDVFAWFSL